MKAGELVALAATLPLHEGLAREREMFMELMATAQSRALRAARTAISRAFRLSIHSHAAAARIAIKMISNAEIMRRF